MATQNSSRISDIGSILTVGSTGFAVRKRTGVGVVIHFFLLFAMCVMGASLLVWYQSPEGCVLAIVIGACFALIAQNLEKMKKIKQSLEFMNALFSSALGKGHQFCCIIKNTGEIVFYNRAFQACFPAYIAQSDRNVSQLLNLYTVAQEHKDKLSALMAANTEGMVSTTFREESATSGVSMTMYIEPIERPTGYFLVRGK